MELLLIRHAQPERLVVAEGERADPDLTDTGRGQADAVAAWLAGDEREHAPITAIYASPLRRAIQTATPLQRTLALDVAIRDDLAEWDRDAMAYIPMEELKAADHDIWRAMSEGRFDDLGIDVAAFRRRVDHAIDTIAAAHPGERVAVVAHGGVVNTYVAGVLGLDAMLFFEPDYTSVTRVLVSRAGVRSVRSLNETGHLRAL